MRAGRATVHHARRGSRERGRSRQQRRRAFAAAAPAAAAQLVEPAFGARFGGAGQRRRGFSQARAAAAPCASCRRAGHLPGFSAGSHARPSVARRIGRRRQLPSRSRRAAARPPATRLRPSPVPGLRTALLEPHEALQHRSRSASGMPGPLSATRQHDVSPIARPAEIAICGASPASLGIFDGVVDEVGERLAEQFAVARERDRPGVDHGRQLHARLLRHRLVELGDVARRSRRDRPRSSRRRASRPRCARSSAAR